LMGFDGAARPIRIMPSEHLPGLRRRSGAVFRQAPAYPIRTQEQEAHGFTAGQPLSISTGTWEVATDYADAVCLKVRTVDRFDVAYLTAGQVAFPAHPYGATPGLRYLSGGELVEDRPPGTAQAVLLVKSASSIVMLSQPAVPA
jgi:hypothetical protein